jgi:hypothetical protein
MVRISHAQETRFENASRSSNLEYYELEEDCNSLLSYQVMHQMISPAGHNFTRLVVLAEHMLDHNLYHHTFFKDSEISSASSV